MVDNYAALFNCTPVGRASDSMMPSTSLFILVGCCRSFLSVAWPTGVQLVLFFCSGLSVSYWARPGISIVGQLTESMSPRFRFIMVVIMIYLFVLDDSLIS